MINDEIKEILNRLEYDKDDVYYVGYTDGVNIDNTLMPKDIKLLLDYITNLQQENQDLSRMCELYGKSLYNAELTDYKSRCEKAVEYINENWGHWCSDHCTHATETINILNGRSDE